MATRFRKQPYSRMSLKKLKEIECEILTNNPGVEEAWILYEKEEVKLCPIREREERREDAQKRLWALEEKKQKRGDEKYARLSFLRKIFPDPRMWEYTVEEGIELRCLRSISDSNYEPAYNKYEILIKKKRRLEKIRGFISKKEIQLKKKQNGRAIIAAYQGKSRSAAESIKAKIAGQLSSYNLCPYCNSNIGDNPECDHIYPIAKGGLSVEENMVFVCKKCNQKKRDRTLAQFIKTEVMDRCKIEEVLDILGKKY